MSMMVEGEPGSSLMFGREMIKSGEHLETLTVIGCTGWRVRDTEALVSPVAVRPDDRPSR